MHSAYRVLPSFTEFYRVFFSFCLGFSTPPTHSECRDWGIGRRQRVAGGFYRVLPSFTEFFFCSLRVDGEVRPSFALETTQRERERERERTGGIPHSVGLTALSFVFQIETGMDANANGPNKTERERERNVVCVHWSIDGASLRIPKTSICLVLLAFTVCFVSISFSLGLPSIHGLGRFFTSFFSFFCWV